MPPQLVGTDAHDAMTFIGVGAVLLATALVACLVPARRASRVDPIDAPRIE